jgi:hypothetical protein
MISFFKKVFFGLTIILVSLFVAEEVRAEGWIGNLTVTGIGLEPTIF